MSAEKNNIVFFSSNKNLFNRVFDIKLLDPKELDKRGSILEKAIPNIIKMVNDIYDELEKNNLKIPIFNNDDNKILNKRCFRELRELLNQQNKRTKNNTMEIE